jgi:DNA topoisomerase I
MAKNLLIVESPAKAKTIEKLLGADFTVRSSYGHIRDLIKDSKDEKAIDVANNYKLKYAISPEKSKVVRELKEQIKTVDEVWLATDEDREGEAIAWHLAEVLGLKVSTTKRITFREITKTALQKAVQSPRALDMDLVNAQQARRALDRLVGFELSGLLWKKVKGGLSAGRVQSVAVRLVVDKEREIQGHQTNPFFKIAAYFEVQSAQKKTVLLKAQHPKQFDKQADAQAFLERCKAAIFSVHNVTVKPASRRPAAPFTTSTLQQEASRKLGFSVSRTMSVAQSLYESGHITYMRTDSTNISDEAIQTIAQTITQTYGKEYVNTQQYKNKVANAQEAHEAIRPTYPANAQINAGRDEQRLYELIWKRTIASQMQDAKLERTIVDIAISTIADNYLVAEGEVIKFDGFLKVYLEDNDDDVSSDGDDSDSGLLPPLAKGQILPLKDMTATERFTKSAARFTEASLVKKLEELGIGRPSTYANIISKIMEDSRGYVTKENRDGVVRPYKVLTLNASTQQIAQSVKQEVVGAEKQKLFASDIGMVVTDFLAQHFEQVMNYKFTANVEGDLDEVSMGKANWIKTIDKIYKPFHAIVEATAQDAERATGERILGKHPQSGRTVLTRVAKYGPLVQIGTTEEMPEGEKPLYANLQPNQSIESISLEEALTLFQLPKTLGKHKDIDVVISSGRYGAYIKYGTSNINLPKTTDPMTVELPLAVRLIDEKLAADAPIGHYQDKPITKGAGRFGPFVKWNDIYVSIPKRPNLSFDTINEAQAVVLIEEKNKKEAERYIQSWAEYNLAIENGRWGPFIRYGKVNFKLIEDGQKIPAEVAATLTLKQVVAIVAAQGTTISLTPPAPKAAKEASEKTAKPKRTKK